MKKIIIFLLLAALFVIPAFSKGTIGVGASHQLVLVKGQKGIVSHGVVAEVTGHLEATGNEDTPYKLTKLKTNEYSLCRDSYYPKLSAVFCCIVTKLRSNFSA